MTILLDELTRVDPAATLHRGKYKHVRGGDPHYHEAFASDWVGRGSALKSYSNFVEDQKLAPIRARLLATLGLNERDVLTIPMYFKLPTDRAAPIGSEENRTVGENVGMVNMQVVNDHLMVPRPHGPRLPPADAQRVVANTLRRWFRRFPPIPAVRLPSSDEHFFWARPGETVEHLALYFARPVPAAGRPADEPRRMIVDYLSGYRSSIPAHYQAAVNTLRDAIVNDPANTGAPTPIDRVAPPPARRFTNWMRVKIPDGTVDVIEAYMKSILEPLGNTVHFIENYESYHEMFGEVHCGTNAKRTPPELDSAFADRWWDAGVYDPDYDTSYDPTR